METKKQKIVSAVATIGIVLTLFGATYAYFASLVDAGKITDVEITANTVDVFSFETGDPISLNINQENFASGKGNQTDSTFARAMLSANNKTNTATEHYYLYLSILNNTFTYSKDSTYPEILVKITDSDGNELVDSDVEGLTHKTVIDAQGNTVTGFDVTEKQGTITILSNREIITTSTKSESWTFTFTFVNYDFNQAANAGGNFSARVLIKKNGATMSDVCKSGDRLSDCIIAMYGIDDTLYYHDENLENGANDNSYRYSGGNWHPDYYACSYNNVPVLNYTGEYNKSLLSDCDRVYRVTTQDGTVNYMDASFETYYYNTYNVEWDSENEICLIENTQLDVLDFFGKTITDSTYCTGFAYQWEDKDYYFLGIEYVGKGTATLYLEDGGVNNYVCFGSDADACPTDNLYRIIGVFDGRVRLIKADYANSDLLGTDGDYFTGDTGSASSFSNYTGSKTTIDWYSWNNANYSASCSATNYYNDWSYSQLNTVNLNTNYLSNIGSKWANMIDKTTWKVGGNTYDNLMYSNAQTAYTNEITSPSTQVTSTYESKVGLMYVSDYGFATSPSAWTTMLYNYYGNDASGNKITEENWMYMGLGEWTMARSSSYSNGAYSVTPSGTVYSGGVTDGGFAVRPVFHLTFNVEVLSGDGTLENPLKISNGA